MELAKFVLLLVDDDHLQHRAMARAALESDVEFVHVMTAQEVLPFIAQRRPDAILLDLGLPDTDGRDLLAHIKGTPSLRDIPVYVYSGRQDHETRLAVLALGADNFFEKPFDASMLIRRITKHSEKVRVPAV